MDGFSFFGIDFLLFAFGNLRIFYLIALIVFSFVFGLGISFWILDQIHILALVVSASLIGIILDFVIHLICHFEGRRIENKHKGPLKRIFLLAFLISASGYALFLFSPLVFLKQIAIISIFCLLGAVMFSYFCLPVILDGVVFGHRMQRFLTFIWRGIGLLRSYRWIFYAVIVCVSVIGIIKLWERGGEENIKTYASPPKSLLEDTLRIQELTGISPPTQVIMLSYCDFACERMLISRLKEQNITNVKGLSQFFLEPKEQRELLDIFKNASQNQVILNLYAKLGIKNLDPYFKQISQIGIQSLKTSLNNPITKSFLPLYLDENHRLLILNHSKNLSQSQEFSNLLQEISRQTQSQIAFFNLTQEINSGFTSIKRNAIVLKLVGLFLIIVFLGFFFTLREALKAMGIMILSIMFVLGVMGILGLDFNLFAVFGLILFSAMGVDYIIFAKNIDLVQNLRLKSIVCACLTSFISFFVLFFSSTPAISIFGLCVSLGILMIALLANIEFNRRNLNARKRS